MISLVKDLKAHGPIYGFLVHWAQLALDADDCAVKHIPKASPFFHNVGKRGALTFDEACVRCGLQEGVKLARKVARKAGKY